MTRVLSLALIALAIVGGAVSGVSAQPAAPTPQVTITGFIDTVSSFSKNLNDSLAIRTGEREWYARNRGRFDIIGQLGTAKAVFGVEIDQHLRHHGGRWPGQQPRRGRRGCRPAQRHHRRLRHQHRRAGHHRGEVVVHGVRAADDAVPDHRARRGAAVRGPVQAGRLRQRRLRRREPRLPVHPEPQGALHLRGHRGEPDRVPAQPRVRPRRRLGDHHERRDHPDQGPGHPADLQLHLGHGLDRRLYAQHDHRRHRREPELQPVGHRRGRRPRPVREPAHRRRGHALAVRAVLARPDRSSTSSARATPTIRSARPTTPTSAKPTSARGSST